MRRTWQIFLAAILFVLGLQLNFTETFFVFNLGETLKNLVFFVLLILVVVGIWAPWQQLKDISTMAIIIIAMHYYCGKVDWSVMTSVTDSFLLKGISIVMIVGAVLILFWTKIESLKELKE